MKRDTLALLALLATLTAFPLHGQDATPAAGDPLAADSRILQARAQATPPPRESNERSVTSDVLGILTGAADQTSATSEIDNSVRAILLGVDGRALGEVSVSPLVDGLLLIRVSGAGLPPGFHGFHVHETGECDASGIEPFGSAGAHLNETDAEHARHAGDLPVLYVTANGLAGMAVVTDRLTLDQLLDADGSAFIVHEGADNYANLPARYGEPDADTRATGDSAARIACAVFAASGVDSMTEDAAS